MAYTTSNVTKVCWEYGWLFQHTREDHHVNDEERKVHDKQAHQATAVGVSPTNILTCCSTWASGSGR